MMYSQFHRTDKHFIQFLTIKPLSFAYMFDLLNNTKYHMINKSTDSNHLRLGCIKTKEMCMFL